jgi:hypothetical protein
MASKLELEDSITRPKVNKKTDGLIVRYDSNGSNDANRDIKFRDDVTAAVVVKMDNSTVFKIKALNGGKLYNPLKDSARYGLNKKERTTKEPLFKFRVVSEKAFSNYLNFLKTKYDSHLTSAEREL